MALLDDLKGLLSPEEFAKLENKPGMKDRLNKGDELYSFYVGEEPPTTATTTTTATEPAARTAPPNPFDLSAIDSMFDRKLAKINETIEQKITEAVTTRGNELVNNAVKISIQRADELNRVYARHSQEFGTAFDSGAFNEFLEKPENKNRFRSVTEAYEAMVGPQLEEKRINAKVEERVKAKSGTNVPGTTPAPATSGNIMKFIKRGGPADGAPATGAQRAAAALDRLTASRSEAAS